MEKIRDGFYDRLTPVRAVAEIEGTLLALRSHKDGVVGFESVLEHIDQCLIIAGAEIEHFVSSEEYTRFQAQGARATVKELFAFLKQNLEDQDWVDRYTDKVVFYLKHYGVTIEKCVDGTDLELFTFYTGCSTS